MDPLSKGEEKTKGKGRSSGGQNERLKEMAKQSGPVKRGGDWAAGQIYFEGGKIRGSIGRGYLSAEGGMSDDGIDR